MPSVILHKRSLFFFIFYPKTYSQDLPISEEPDDLVQPTQLFETIETQTGSILNAFDSESTEPCELRQCPAPINIKFDLHSILALSYGFPYQ